MLRRTLLALGAGLAAATAIAWHALVRVADDAPRLRPPTGPVISRVGHLAGTLMPNADEVGNVVIRRAYNDAITTSLASGSGRDRTEAAVASAVSKVKSERKWNLDFDSDTGKLKVNTTGGRVNASTSIDLYKTAAFVALERCLGLVERMTEAESKICLQREQEKASGKPDVSAEF